MSKRAARRWGWAANYGIRLKASPSKAEPPYLDDRECSAQL
ncbi:hypothetical protein F441_12352 [Phytophthora nicotianae CJ01A1]|uniref:Uncharacterized protein n=5 Tax=Phytophthora nicotianae TaxID=4792 RepID=W2Q0X9_PHYN3|nr:hypothetical protein PPTG_23413 [Phytophthora nicotianae INRA-310]ETI42553.1 hypothetical protein F443_12367 [Phytophthora nicotianae P1569]ETO71146.1 hypothetical protein F444_12467 [Phytophthora nicotianae P1976]ETP12269.1 hypothetical protein F441_12352 [Phytophthora nicotianae CJ01A1]ETP40398.1 hypothetical protein F442_12284 [Phytophthora nicotianae P10297]ETN06189.1 hypothetical protein PPTG_23413 [Phytophthora nicotianae INRA-310]